MALRPHKRSALYRIAVLISGRGSNLAALIQSIHNSNLAAEIVVVISSHCDAGGLQKAIDAGVPVSVIDRREYDKRQFEEEILATLRAFNINLVVLAGFQWLLSGDFIAHFPAQIINIHPSLLPLFPGKNAQSQALVSGFLETGATVHFVDEGMDTGPIILQKSVPILPDDSVESLSMRILEVEHEILCEAVKLAVQNRLQIVDGVVQILSELQSRDESHC